MEPIDTLYEGMSDTDLKIIARGKDLLLLEYDLISTLRKDRELTQTELAEILDIRQSAISQIENQHDVLLSTLERYVNALGGTLEVWARFPERAVRLRQFTAGSEGTSTQRVLGTEAGRFVVPDDFNDELDFDSMGEVEDLESKEER